MMGMYRKGSFGNAHCLNSDYYCAESFSHVSVSTLLLPTWLSPELIMPKNSVYNRQGTMHLLSLRPKNGTLFPA